MGTILGYNNRVMQIRNKQTEHRFCEGKQNLADLLSRGTSAKTLKQSRWLSGPPWITDHLNYQPVKPLTSQTNATTVDMMRPKHPVWYFEYSTWRQLITVQAMVNRTIKAFKGEARKNNCGCMQ